MAKTIDSYQTPRSVAKNAVSDLGVHCLSRAVGRREDLKKKTKKKLENLVR